MNDSNFQKELLKELKSFIDPLILMAFDETQLRGYFKHLGWNIDALLGAGSNLSDFTNGLKGLSNVINIIEGYIESPPETIGDFVSILTDIPKILEPILNLGSSIDSLTTGNLRLDGVTNEELEELPKEIIEGITLFYLNSRSPKIFYFLRLIGVIRQETREPIINSLNAPIRASRVLHSLRFDKVPLLFSDPLAYFNELYALDFTDTQSIGVSSGLLLENIGLLLASFKVSPIMGREGLSQLPSLTLQEEKELASLVLKKRFEFADRNLESAQFMTVGVLLRLLSQTEQGPGLRLEPFGEVDLSTIIGDWEIGLELDAGVGIIDILQSGFQIHPSGTSGNLIPAFKAALKITKLGEDDLGGQALFIGSTTGTRFEIAKIAFKGFFELKNLDEKDFGFGLELGEAAFVIQGGDGDGFLAKILPEEGIRIAFDMGLEWTNKKGFKFTFGISAGTALELVIPINETLFNVIDFKDIRLRLGAEEGNKGFSTAIGGTVGVSIGPFKAMVENMGVKAIFNLPESGGGNLGPLDLDFDFKPPSGIAMSIDASGFKGGGFLSITPDRYVGALQLTFASGFNITAICIITTKLPGGEEGFSLLVVITVEFSPGIQIGMGISIIGFGGMLGLHRSIDPNALRSGLKTGMLESILFPQDILGNPDKVISDLDSAFPIEKDHFVFGPMLKATWGSESFVNISFGLMIELPNPRIILPGLISISLLDDTGGDDGEDSVKVLDINIAFIGIIDIPAKMVSIDASIYNSKILVMVIEGDMAFRLTWGENPIFVLSMGGFYPGFTPPPLGLSEMNRLSIFIFNDEDLKLYAMCYMAITSNTFQFGGEIVFYAKLGPLEVNCFFGLDTIFFFNPFAMEVGIRMGGQISWDGTPLLSLIIEATLSGPSPWRIYGQVQIVIAEIVDFEFIFDEEFGNTIPESIPTIELGPILRKELMNTENWMPYTEFGQNDLVTLGKGPEEIYLIRPMGGLKISQNKVPLDLKMEKFGTDTISGADQFEIATVKINGVEFDAKPVEDLFAPVEFQKIEDNTAAVESEAYENYKSGVQISAKLSAGSKKSKRIDHELIIIDARVESPIVVNTDNGTTTADDLPTDVLTDEATSGLKVESSMDDSSDFKKSEAPVSKDAKADELSEFADDSTDGKGPDIIEEVPARDMGIVYNSALVQEMELKGNLISKSDLSAQSPIAKAKAKNGIKVFQQKYRIINKVDLSPIDDNTYGYAEAKHLLKTELAEDPTLANLLQIVPISKVDNNSVVAITNLKQHS